MDKYREEHKVLDRKDKQLSVLRFILFAISLVLVIYAANERAGMLLSITLLAFFASFGFLIRMHNKIKFKNDLSIFLAQLNEEE